MTKKRFVTLLGLAAAVTLISAHFLQAQEKLKNPDTQKVLLENQFVQVIDVRVPAGVAEALHTHGRGVTIALTREKGPGATAPTPPILSVGKATPPPGS